MPGHSDFHGTDKHTNVTRTIFIDPSVLEVGTSVTHQSYGQGVALKYPFDVIGDAKGNFQIPSDFVGPNIKFTIWWNCTPTTGDVYWKIYLNWTRGDDYYQDKSTDSGTTMKDTAHPTAGYTKKTSWTASGDFQKGDVVQIALDRRATEAGDNMTDYAYAFGIEVEYTAEQ